MPAPAPYAPDLDKPGTTPSDAPRTAVRVASNELMRGQRSIEINHAGQNYRLSVTRENKLILTK